MQFIKKEEIKPIKGSLYKRAANIPALIYKIIVKIVEAIVSTTLAVAFCFCCFA